MPFEIVPSPHLPPNRCAACGCTEPGPHVFIPNSPAWEYNFVFICQRCVAEAASLLGITAPQVEVRTVEVVREPTEQEIRAAIASQFTLTPIAEVTSPAGSAAPAGVGSPRKAVGAGAR